ncbi:tRNA lysidine(34) synthetase TilS [Ferruginibacter sp.]|uniref:tRNA lysidine(34) synthetase TilS n=1 Tax=Ferruginibacter sp. TaxID=1940288 RepID=UPI002657EDC5|nr:tRNA lysidine(34) synthetase TilS [Ferruginibacter sp.]
MELFENFITYNKKENLFQSKDKLLLAVSGGVDSVVLCALCKQAGYDFAIAHCNFKLREAASDRDAEFVQQLAATYCVSFYIKTFDTISIATDTKKSIEETARDLRYQWFETLRVENKYDHIVTAHHADDNIETVVMNFFRGTGIKGLRGILPKQNKIVRPLLFARRMELETFTAIHQLAFVTDYTNAQNEYTRNYFRNEILPMVSRQFPEAKENILKNIQRLNEVEILYRFSVDMNIKKLVEIKGNEAHMSVLKLLKTVPLTTVMYEIIKDYGFTAHQTDESIALLQSETGKYIQSATHRIFKNRQWLIIAPLQSEAGQHILIEENNKKVIFEAGELQIEKLEVTKVQLTSDILTALLDADEISFPLLLRKWKQGDYFYPLGMKKKKKLNRFLTDQKLSLTQKENTWVIEMNKKIIWVTGKRIDDRFKIYPVTKKILKFTYLPK